MSKIELPTNLQVNHSAPVYDSGLLIRAVYSEIDRRVTEGGDKSPASVVLPGALRRPKVFVATREEQKYVTTAEQLLELVSCVDHIVEEKSYCGYDHEDVVVLRCKLPHNYVARVPYIKVKHIPHKYLANDGVVIKRMPPKKGYKNGQGEVVTLCRDLQPIWTDRSLFEIKKDVIEDAYNHLTVKIRREDHSLKSWFPGVDTNCGLCESIDEQFVLIGAHYDGSGQVYQHKQQPAEVVENKQVVEVVDKHASIQQMLAQAKHEFDLRLQQIAALK
jgi:hypothetical protein